uniref:Ubiquitin carboxyl-terminal hydrolase n=1 Tax=Heterorhabditis bacteriophora TaxID=37862 RepID=A0A1I7XN32_HETBA
MTSSDSSGLNYASFESLRNDSELPADMIKKLQKYSCDDVFSSLEKMVQEARKSRGDMEKQYKLFYRSAELAQMIRKKNGFKDFLNTKEKIFGLRFKESVEETEKLTTLLTKKYEDKLLRSSLISKPPSTPRIFDVQLQIEKGPHIIPQAIISPKELVRMVQQAQPKKSAVIIDYRSDKSETICYKNDNLITVVAVPNDLILPGLIFSTLRNQLEVGQRALLNRIGTSDMVVLMDDHTPHMINNEPVQKSKAQLLCLALYEKNDLQYNRECPPKRRPLYMDGGFENWRDQYPVYTRSDSSIKRNEPKDMLDQMVSNYKKARLVFEYPDLSPQKFVPELSKLGNGMTNVIENISKVSLAAGIVSNSVQNGISDNSGVTSVPVTRTETTFPVDSNNSVSSVEEHSNDSSRATGPLSSVSPKTNGVASTDILSTSPKPYASKETTIGFGATINGDGSLLSRIPAVDRTNKPIQNTARPTFMATPRSALGSGVPQPDRSTKPCLMSVDQEHQLLKIYSQMTESIEESSIQRGNPRPGYTGLYNMGNTCFMNATLQALFHTPQLADLFTKENFLSKVNPHNRMGTGGIISSVFSSMMDIVWSGQYSAIRPQRFLRLFANQVNSCLADGQQHDASEFQLFLLDALHEDTNQVLNRISFEQNYRGGLNINDDAKDYAEKNKRFAYSPINRVFNRLDGDCRWNCPRCRSPQPAIRRTKLWTLPPVLVVHLKRFSMENGEYAKNTMNVEFDPALLDVSQHLHQRSQASLEGYRLYAVTNHRGRLNSGHYTALVCHARTGDWLRFDDESVTVASASSIDASDAYMLYYKKHNL